MEVSALKHAGVAGIHGRSPLLRLQSDERLVALVRRGNHHAFEALVARYESRLLAFCRHMLSSREDAEDVLQEVFAAAFNALLADERGINVRPWLYRIARNRSLNHLRRAQAVGVDSMDVHLSEGGITTADKVHRREEFRLLISDVQDLPESQRTALLLREIDALSYDQIAEAMETTVPSVKSLLVRARVGLAEAAEARQLSCEEVREELGEVAEGLRRTTASTRRHLRSCERCQGFRTQLRQTNKALAAIFPVGPLLLTKKLILAQLGTTAAAGGGATAAGTGGAAAAGAVAGGALQAGMGAVITKAAAGLAAAAIVTAGAVEVKHVAADQSRAAARPAQVAGLPPATEPASAVAFARPVALAAVPEDPIALPPTGIVPETRVTVTEPVETTEKKAAEPEAKPQAVLPSAPAPAPSPAPATEAVPSAEPVAVDRGDSLPAAPVIPDTISGSDTTTLPDDTNAITGQPDGVLVSPQPQADPLPAPPTAQPQPVANPEPGPEPQPVAGPEPLPVASPEPQPVAGPEPQPVSGPEPQPVSGPEPLPVAGPEPQPVAGPEPQPVVADPVADPDPQPAADPEPQPVVADPVADPDPQPAADPDPQPAPEQEPQPVLAPAPPSTPEPVAEAPAEPVGVVEEPETAVPPVDAPDPDASPGLPQSA